MIFLPSLSVIYDGPGSRIRAYPTPRHSVAQSSAGARVDQILTRLSLPESREA